MTVVCNLELGFFDLHSIFRDIIKSSGVAARVLLVHLSARQGKSVILHTTHVLLLLSYLFSVLLYVCPNRQLQLVILLYIDSRHPESVNIYCDISDPQDFSDGWIDSVIGFLES